MLLIMNKCDFGSRSNVNKRESLHDVIINKPFDWLVFMTSDGNPRVYSLENQGIYGIIVNKQFH